MARPRRILLVEDDEPLCRSLQDELEADGLAAACVGASPDQAAGLAFGPDMIIVSPDTSAKDAFQVFPQIASAAPSVPLLLADTHIESLARSAGHAARMNAIQVMGIVDRPYSVRNLEMLAGKCPDRDPPPGSGDEAFIRALIESDRLIGNLAVEFQPKHDLKTDAIAGFEALTRLRPRRAINPEMIFSQLVALDTEFSATMLVVEEATGFAAALRKAGRPQGVSLNCSAAVLAHGGFAVALGEAMSRRRLDAGRMTVEITEDARLADSEALLHEVRALAALGVGISLDDFGTGMANLDRVSRLPFTELKVDKSIFWACAEGQIPTSMLTGILEFCRARQIKSVIEGIETKVQLAHAKLLGADYGQGFYWGRAAPPQFLLPEWA